ncbi:hypothetical protein [Lentzea kentuckyensis]|uniref:hypothetical protein n=1 Tax=Lentzea kentuckyensis TaxID=360086 RepID=UPI000A3A9103|nr:hypothetical protein [Lentzea kentuckyensis]
MPEQDSQHGRVAVIDGGRPLRGRVTVPGTKHGTVLAFAATVATGATVALGNVPALTDRLVLSDIVRALGGRVEGTGTSLEVHGKITDSELPAELTRLVHGSLYLLPAVLAQRGSVVFHGAGGDGLGRFERGLARPIDHMLEVMAEFGATARWESGTTLRVTAETLRPATIDISRWSTDPVLPEGPRVSGASKTALLMAAASPGTSIILHPHAREAQHELISLLRAIGVTIEQRDACWLVTGGSFRTATTPYDLMPCPVEWATWQAIAAMTGSELTLDVGDAPRLFSAVHRELAFLRGFGIEPEFGADTVTVRPAPGPYAGAKLVAESTGISTDITPLLALMLHHATSESTVEDRIWGSRFDYAAQLELLGADVRVEGETLIIRPSRFREAAEPLRPSDTRSAAVCVAAALTVPGRTVVHGIDHLDRGYGHFARRLRALGAGIAITG